MFIKDGTYRDVSIAGLTAPIYEGTVLTESGAIAKADGSDAFGIVPENIYIMPPTKMTRVAIGGTIDLQDPANAHVTISKAVQDALSADINFIPGAGALPVVDAEDDGKFLVVEDGKWNAGGTDVIEGAVGDWLDAHPEATTTVQDGSVTDAKLAQAGGVLSEVHDVRVGADGVTYASAGAAVRGQVNDLKSLVNLSHTINLFDPINKSGTVDGITYAFSNGNLKMQGTKTGWVIIQTLTGNIGDVYTLSSMAISAKPSIYIRDGGTNIATFAAASESVEFTMPSTSVNISAYMSGAFDFTFALTLVKSEIGSFPLLLHENGENTIKNFADCTYEAIGDSLTYGFTGSWDQGQQVRVNTPYPDVIKNILGFKTALNKGETGTTIANDLDKKGTYYPISNDNRLNGYSYAQVISVMGGTNDFTLGTSLGTIYDSQDMSTFHAGWKRILSSLVGRFSQYNAFVFVIIPPVTQGLYTDNSAGVKWIDYINATFEECRNYGVPVLDMSIMGRLTNTNKTIYTSDGIHFNQRYITRIFAPMVAEFIKNNCF